MDKLILEKMINDGLSQREIGVCLRKSQASVKYWLAKFNLKTNFAKKIFKCKVCGEEDKKLLAFRKGKICSTLCKKCDAKRSLDKCRNTKLKAIEYKGSKCSVCGYAKNVAALSFHHINPEDKDPNFSKMKFWNFERITEELDKCDLVCMNCHAEIHYPYHNLE